MQNFYIKIKNIQNKLMYEEKEHQQLDTNMNENNDIMKKGEIGRASCRERV